MKKISDMITSPKWTLQKALDLKTLDKNNKKHFHQWYSLLHPGPRRTAIEPTWFANRGIEPQQVQLDDSWCWGILPPSLFSNSSISIQPPIKRVCLGSSLAPWPAPWVPLMRLKTLPSSPMADWDQRLDLKNFRIAKTTFPSHDAKLVRKNNLVKPRIKYIQDVFELFLSLFSTKMKNILFQELFNIEKLLLCWATFFILVLKIG